MKPALLFKLRDETSKKKNFKYIIDSYINTKKKDFLS